MKDNFFEMLMHLFEQTLTQLKDKNTAVLGNQASPTDSAMIHESADPVFSKPARTGSTRIFTPLETMRLTKASYQFLIRVHAWEILAPDVFELIMNQLLFSESRFISLQEIKWIIRGTLASSLSLEQLAFLDLVLYQKEDALLSH
jgi:uncharacterized protein Smg (DUF494 family)